jgi:ribonuclease-3
VELRKLERKLGYEFNDAALLEQALTHKSHGTPNNERLEFLGDAVLGDVIAHELYLQHQTLAEDALTLMRASLVRKETLHQIAVQLSIGDCLRLGIGERKSGGRERASILADALEAIIGAVRLDGGIEAAHTLVKQIFEQRLQAVTDQEFKDSKTRLQELLQSRKLSLPAYDVVATQGSEHNRTFTVHCVVLEFDLTAQGSGPSRRDAEKAAAETMLERLAEHITERTKDDI